MQALRSGNTVLWWITGATLAAMAAAIYVPPAAAVFRFSALEPHWMLVATASGIVGVLPYEVYKLARPRREPA